MTYIKKILHNRLFILIFITVYFVTNKPSQSTTSKLLIGSSFIVAGTSLLFHTLATEHPTSTEKAMIVILVSGGSIGYGFYRILK